MPRATVSSVKKELHELRLKRTEQEKKVESTRNQITWEEKRLKELKRQAKVRRRQQGRNGGAGPIDTDSEIDELEAIFGAPSSSSAAASVGRAPAVQPGQENAPPGKENAPVGLGEEDDLLAAELGVAVNDDGELEARSQHLL